MVRVRFFGNTAWYFNIFYHHIHIRFVISARFSRERMCDVGGCWDTTNGGPRSLDNYTCRANPCLEWTFQVANFSSLLILGLAIFNLHFEFWKFPFPNRVCFWLGQEILYLSSDIWTHRNLFFCVCIFFLLYWRPNGLLLTFSYQNYSSCVYGYKKTAFSLQTKKETYHTQRKT